MAERTLVGRGRWLPVPDGADDVVAAALLNPGMAAWKTIVWEGEVSTSERVLILGATSTAGRIAIQLALAAGAHVIVAGRAEAVLEDLVSLGAEAAIRLDESPQRLAALIAASGPYDLVADFVWGAPAEATFTALESAGAGPARVRYILVGMAAGERASLPAMALRQAPLHLVGSGTSRPLSIEQSGVAYGELLAQAAAGRISIDIDVQPLAGIEKIWSQAGTSRRVVLIP
jgi:NADPH:quinone reductase-like Zn-dependent oxidoreductase